MQVGAREQPLCGPGHGVVKDGHLLYRDGGWADLDDEVQRTRDAAVEQHKADLRVNPAHRLELGPGVPHHGRHFVPPEVVRADGRSRDDRTVSRDLHTRRELAQLVGTARGLPREQDAALVSS